MFKMLFDEILSFVQFDKSRKYLFKHIFVDFNGIVIYENWKGMILGTCSIKKLKNFNAKV